MYFVFCYAYGLRNERRTDEEIVAFNFGGGLIPYQFLSHWIKFGIYWVKSMQKSSFFVKAFGIFLALMILVRIVQCVSTEW